MFHEADDTSVALQKVSEKHLPTLTITHCLLAAILAPTPAEGFARL